MFESILQFRIEIKSEDFFSVPKTWFRIEKLFDDYSDAMETAQGNKGKITRQLSDIDSAINDLSAFSHIKTFKKDLESLNRHMKETWLLYEQKNESIFDTKELEDKICRVQKEYEWVKQKSGRKKSIRNRTKLNIPSPEPSGTACYSPFCSAQQEDLFLNSIIF